MADFNVDMTDAQGQGTAPVAPVTPHISPNINPWPGFALGAAGMFMKYYKDTKEQEKQQQIDTVVANFTREQTSLNDAVAQGVMTPGTAAARQRANYSKYAAQYPALIKHFKETNNALTEGTSLGNFQNEQKLAQENENLLIRDMQKDGYPVSSNMNPATLEAFKTSYQMTRKVQSEFEWMAKQNAEKRAQSTEDRNQFQFLQKERTGRLLGQLGDAHGQSALAYINDLAAMPDKTQAMQLLQQHFSGIEMQIAAMTSSNPELGGSWNKIFQDMKRYGEDRLSGKLAGESAENTLKDVKARLQLMALSGNPKMQGLYAFNALAPNAVAVSHDINTTAMDVLAQFSKPGGALHINIVGNPEVERGVLGGLKANVDALSKNPYNKEQIEREVGNGTGVILEQLDKALSNGLAAKDLASTVDYIASPQYAEIVKRKLVNKEQSNTAKTSFQYLYEREVAGAVESRLDTKFRDNKTYRDVLQLNWVGAGVAAEMNQKINYLDPTERQTRDQFLRELGPVTKGLNTLIKAGAHMEGHTDYALYWEENKHRILPSMYEAPEGEGAKQQALAQGGRAVSANSLKEGMTFDGWKFLGGDPTNKKSWERIQ